VTLDSQQIISGSSDKSIKLWDLNTGQEILNLRGHTAEVNAIALTPDNQWIISASSDSNIKAWSLKTGEELFNLTGHIGEVGTLTITPDGKRLISLSWNESIKVWDLEKRESIASFSGDRSLIVYAVAPDGMTIVAGEVSGRVHFLRLEGV
jgi:WD40 repeat protein